MIVDESAILSAALSRRLQVDRVLAVDPGRALLDPADPPLAPSAARTHSQIPTTLPLGSIVIARALADLAGRTLAATIDDLAIEMDWPATNGPAPKAGEHFPLRVLAHRPSLILQALAPQDTIEPAHWSLDPSRLQVVRFEHSWIAPDIVPAPLAETVAATHPPRRDAEPMPFMPLVLQGPAWTGQPMELVVRRDRADDGFDNAALDNWCGEVVIDLPHLGRVAGHLAFSMQGLRVRLEADDDTSVAAMTDAAADLAIAFGSAGLRVAGLSVGGGTLDGRTAHG